MCSFFAVLTALAQDKPNPLAQIQDTPGLPRVLLIGDSISIGYTLPVRRLLAGKANVHRIAVNANDLHAFAVPRLAEIQRPNNVHFTDAGSDALARQVAAAIEQALPHGG